MQKTSYTKICILFLSMLLGCILLSIFNNYKHNEIKDFDNKQCRVVGIIGKEGVNKNSYWEYVLKENVIDGRRISSNIILKAKTQIEYGSKVEMVANLALPKGSRNSNTFDYAKYLKPLNIYITAEAKHIHIIDGNHLSLIERMSYTIRKKVREFTNDNLDIGKAGILNALIIGDESQIGKEIENDYKKAGMLHLLVVSGGHTVFLIMLLKFIFSFLEISRNMSKALYILIIFLYIFITGGTPSILRAGIGIIIVIISELIGRQNDGYTTLSIVAFLLLLNNPNTLFSMSFLLSFGGVIGIMLFYPKFSNLLIKFPKFISEPLALTLSAQLFVTPITIYSFNTIYFGGIISNLFTLSLSGIIMMIGMIFFVIYIFIPPLVVLPMKILNIFIVIMNKIADFFGNIDGLCQYVITPNMFSIALYYCLLFYIFRKKTYECDSTSKFLIKSNKIKRLINMNLTSIVIVSGIMIMFISNIDIINFSKSLKISVIDVGHGDSILITTPNNKNILIDTGDKYYSGDEIFDSGEQTIIPYLLKKKIKKIDLLILTHMDSDHIGGFESISKVIEIKNLGLSVNSSKKEEYLKMKEIANNEKMSIKLFERGDKFKIDGVNFSILMPEKTKEVLEENNDSVVLLIEYNGKRALFMGDLEEDGEERLLELEKDIDVDILKIGHHGSKTSSTEMFIKRTTPKVALISVGNRFKSIPDENVLNRLSSVYAKVYRTDKMGEINVIINNRGIKVKPTY